MRVDKSVTVLLALVLLAQIAILWVQIDFGTAEDACAAQTFTPETVERVPKEYLEGRVLMSASEQAELDQTLPLLKEIVDQLRRNGRNLEEIRKILIRIDNRMAEKQG